MKSKTAFLFVFTTAMVLPRVAASYLFYTIGSIAPVRFEKRVIARTALYVSLLLIFFLVNYFIGYKVSPTAFVLAFAMHLPLLAFLAGGRYSLERISPTSAIRAISVTVFTLSYLNMIINNGFPFKLPYLHYTPDFYFSLYGLGGAKIVTVIGFFALVSELYPVEGDRSRLFLTVALSNFLVPSYLIGTACGLIALTIANINKVRIQIFVFIVAVLLINFFQSRLNSINTGLADTFGYHPKILALIAVAKLYWHEPTTIFIGTGIGQFASTAAEWGSEYLSLTDRGIKLPGLFMSEFHREYLGDYLSGADKWLISSSMNKPYTSISVIMAEFGFIFSSLIFCRVWWLLRTRIGSDKDGFVITLFCFGVFSLDVWHDNIWFMVMLFLFLARHESQLIIGEKIKSTKFPVNSQ